MALLEDQLLSSSIIPRMTGEGFDHPLKLFFKDFRNVFKKDELGMEIGQIAVPAALALMADPFASLIDTAFIGQIGPVELAGVGVAIAVFNQASKIAIFPLVSVTTSFVAQEDAAHEITSEVVDIEEVNEANGSSEMKELISHDDCRRTEEDSSFVTYSKNMSNGKHGKKHIPSVTSALVMGVVLGLLQAVILICGAKPVLTYMGVKPESPMMIPARRYLTLRSIGAPPILLSLAMQGVFRGLKDTKTPLYATVVGDTTNIVLDPIFIFVFKLGVSGAAIAHVLSQYLIALILLWRLIGLVDVIPSNLKDIDFNSFLKKGFLLLARVIAVTFCVTLAASMAARHGSILMAAFQICLQIWLATSLLADGLAVAGQAILASSFAKRDYHRATLASSRVLQLGLVLGLGLCCILGIGLQFAAKLFTNDAEVLRLVHIGVPFVAITQPMNALAFVFDGINYGASDYAYSAYSMIIVAGISILSLMVLSSAYSFIGIWVALTIYMSLRMFAGFWRLGTSRGPWMFLRSL